MYRSAYIIIGCISFALLMNSCYFGYNDKSKRNKEFAPNMYTSYPPEPYSQEVREDDSSPMNKVFANGLSAQLAPEGTVPRTDLTWYNGEEYEPFHYENNVEAYDSAGQFVTSPIDDSTTNAVAYNCTTESFQKGKEIYEIFCVMCHGANGKGQGNLVTSGAFAAVPAYNDAAHRDLPVGKMYFSITYGKGVMGSYASQLTPKERWQVICYIQEFQKQPM